MYKLQKGENQAHMFFRLLKANKALTVSNMSTVYSSVIIPSLSYGVSFWFHTASFPSNAKIFISLQRKCLLAISGCFRTTSSASLDILIGITPIMIRLEALQCRERLRITGSTQFNNFSFTYSNDHILGYHAERQINIFSKPDFARFMNFLSYQLWEEAWASSPTGRFTFLFFGTVSSRLAKPWFRARGPGSFS